MTRLADPAAQIAELVRALAVVCEPPSPGEDRRATALGLPGLPAAGDYIEVFGLQAFPYASVYLGADGMMGGEARDRIAGFWRALGLPPPPEPDHLAALLGLYAGLIEAERDEPDPARSALKAAARRALLWEHLLSWCLPYLDAVAAIAPAHYAAWAELLSRTMLAEAARGGRQEELPLALRAADPLPAAAATSDAWIAAILAPVRTGFILTRADLGRCARQGSLGLRIGGRAFLLRSLLEQEASRTLGWLAGEAERAAQRHAQLEPDLGPVARFWRGRAEASAAAFRGMLVDS